MNEIDNWTEKFFNNLYWELFMKRTPEAISMEVELIKKILKEKTPTSLMDVCCGVGDIAHALELQYGIPATGIEFSSDYVNNSQLSNIIQGDACQMQNNYQYSLVLNWFSSFAYFSPEKNKQLLSNCFNYCSDVFLLESYNPYAVVRNFKKQFNYEKVNKGIVYNIARDCEIDVSQRMMYQTWNFQTEKQSFSYDTRTYLYFPDELISLLKEIGFKKIEVFGVNDFNLVPLDINTPRMAIRAEK